MYFCVLKKFFDVFFMRDLLLVCLLVALFSCTGNRMADSDGLDSLVLENAPGDSTLYGLACEGCNDSVVVILPYDLSNPQTYNITLAWKNHNIYGFPEIGDNIAVILSQDDSTMAEKVIVTDRIIGAWYYDIKPTIHKPAALTDAQFERMKVRLEKHLTDSARDSIFKPIVCEFAFNSNKTFSMNGMRQIKERKEQSNLSLIDYEHPTMYKEWSLWNGKLLLKQRERYVDTFEIKSLRNDSMVLCCKERILTLHKKNAKK